MIDFFGRKFRTNVVFDPDSNQPQSPDGWAKVTGTECPMSMDATLVVSETTRSWFAFEDMSLKSTPTHAPVIDLDGPHHYEPSSTPGHGHLYLNKDMSFDSMVEILEVLVKHGIVQQGFLDATKQRGFAAARTPWTKK